MITDIVHDFVQDLIGEALFEAMPRFFGNLGPQLSEQYQFPGLTVKSWWAYALGTGWHLFVRVTVQRHGTERQVALVVSPSRDDHNPIYIVGVVIFDLCHAVAHSRFRKK